MTRRLLQVTIPFHMMIARVLGVRQGVKTNPEFYDEQYATWRPRTSRTSPWFILEEANRRGNNWENVNSERDSVGSETESEAFHF